MYIWCIKDRFGWKVFDLVLQHSVNFVTMHSRMRTMVRTETPSSVVMLNLGDGTNSEYSLTLCILDVVIIIYCAQIVKYFVIVSMHKS